jgi:hypothetical protein
MDLEHKSELHERVFIPLLRGMLAGLLGVAAVAVWAVNVHFLFAPGPPRSLWSIILMVVLCDLVPFVTLVCVFRAISTGQSAEQMVGSIFRGIFRRYSRRREREDLDFSPFEYEDRPE